MKKIYSINFEQEEFGKINAYTTDTEHYVFCVMYNYMSVSKITIEEKDGLYREGDEEEVCSIALPCNTVKLAELGSDAFAGFMTAFFYKVLREEGFMIKKEYLNYDIPSFFRRLYNEITETDGEDIEFV